MNTSILETEIKPNEVKNTKKYLNYKFHPYTL